jgi:hypothetical protein
VNLTPIPDFVYLERQREGIWNGISFGVSDRLDLDGAGWRHDEDDKLQQVMKRCEAEK